MSDGAPGERRNFARRWLTRTEVTEADLFAGLRPRLLWPRAGTGCGARKRVRGKHRRGTAARENACRAEATQRRDKRPPHSPLVSVEAPRSITSSSGARGPDRRDSTMRHLARDWHPDPLVLPTPRPAPARGPPLPTRRVGARRFGASRGGRVSGAPDSAPCVKASGLKNLDRESVAGRARVVVAMGRRRLRQIAELNRSRGRSRSAQIADGDHLHGNAAAGSQRFAVGPKPPASMRGSSDAVYQRRIPADSLRNHG